MKAVYLLFVVFIDSEGYESMQRVNNAQYKTKLECLTAKAHYKDIENHISFFCAKESL